MSALGSNKVRFAVAGAASSEAARPHLDDLDEPTEIEVRDPEEREITEPVDCSVVPSAKPVELPERYSFLSSLFRSA